MPNEYVNHVIVNGVTKLDLRADTITASALAQGITAHDRSGAPIVGTGSGGIPSVTQDQDGYLVLDDDQGANVTVESLSVTQNGTYTAPSGKAYSPVTVSVSASPTLKMGVIRPDAELVQSWTYDKYIVEDEGVTLPAFSTSAQTLKASESLSPVVRLEHETYDYYMTMRSLAYPIYASGTTADAGMYDHSYQVWLSEFVRIPYPAFTSIDGTTTCPSLMRGFQDLKYSYSLYRNNGTSTGLTYSGSTTTSYGVYAQLLSPTNSYGTNYVDITVVSPNLRMRGHSSYYAQTFWEATEDIRYQWIIEVWRAPRNNLNIDGWGLQQEEIHVIDCVKSPTHTLT